VRNAEEGIAECSEWGLQKRCMISEQRCRLSAGPAPNKWLRPFLPMQGTRRVRDRGKETAELKTPGLQHQLAPFVEGETGTEAKTEPLATLFLLLHLSARFALGVKAGP